MNHVQSLESRQLLSATFAAAKPKPAPKAVIPNIIGKFKGTSTKRKPVVSAPASLSITFTTETKTGAISGAVLTPGNPAERLAGTVNAKDQVAFNFVSKEHATTTVTGTYHPATHVLSGTYTRTAAKNQPAQSGVFSITLVK